MARTKEITINSVLLPLGQLVRTSPALPAGFSQVQLILQQGVDWINDGSLIFTIALDYAQDGINFTQNLFNDSAYDVSIPAKFGLPAGQMAWGVGIPDEGITGRKIRFTVDVSKRRTVSGELDVL